ncbi:MAG: cation:proton antiporter [Mucilaginibacter polytrichastri]|nr:cation:proton antiporter [Mucilaginibacter polytrichastri]
MEISVYYLFIIGIAALGMAWMPTLAARIGISYSIIYLVLGMLIYWLTGDTLDEPRPLVQNDFVLHLTEIVIIISIMGIGLKIDRPFSLRNWQLPIRLIIITMLVSIAAIAAVAYYFLHLDLAQSLMLGAVLAPTDPVLASDVQVGPPNEGKYDPVRFALTAEAGMNDGSAFPFVRMALAMWLAQSGGGPWFSHWFFYDVLYRIAAAIVIGYILGRIINYFFFLLPEKQNIADDVQEGFVALSATFVIYAVTEMVHGYGFMAVFVAAITLRHKAREHEYFTKLHRFTDQIERMLLAIVLLLLGGSVVNGILDPLDWKLIAAAFVVILFIRPIAGYVGTIGVRMQKHKLNGLHRFAISFFGIKGVGSIYYLTFVLHATTFPDPDMIWAFVVFVILVSIMIHGLTASRIIGKTGTDLELSDMIKT